jgi:hypothetical protein
MLKISGGGGRLTSRFFSVAWTSPDRRGSFALVSTPPLRALPNRRKKPEEEKSKGYAVHRERVGLSRSAAGPKKMEV